MLAAVRRTIVAAAVASTLSLAGCVVAPMHPSPSPYATYGAYPGYPVGEVIVPVAPVAGHLWIDGYWGWYGGRRAWVPGHGSRPHRGEPIMGPPGGGWRPNPRNDPR